MSETPQVLSAFPSRRSTATPPSGGRHEQSTCRPTRRITDRLHPNLYLALVALTLWFVISASAFGGDGYTDYLLVAATGLIAVVIAVLAGLWRIWRNHPHDDRPSGSFREWAATRELRIWQDRVKAKNAAIEILLPVAAVAFGMSILAVVAHFSAR